MATANQRQTFDKRVNTSAGHYVRWEISVKDLHLLRSWHFTKNYRTFCETSPTSWDFKLWFPEVREDGSASLSVVLTRKDTNNVEMGASVWVDISDMREDLIYPRQSFGRGGMVPGNVMEETVQMEPYPFMAPAVNRSAVVLVTLSVSACHSNE